MGKTIAEFTMSLDGFIAGPNDDIRALFGWYRNGDTEFAVAGSDMKFKVSRASAELLSESWSQIGATVTGRRDFDVSNAWGGKSLFGESTFIVTHSAPQEWTYEGSPFTFVTEGVERAVERAQQAAGDKVVSISGTTIVQQCLRAGLLDEIHIHLAPILLGAGIRLFDNLGVEPIGLKIAKVVETPSVTHLQYRVVQSTIAPSMK
jgi:dihydrofolate reductase